MLKIWEGKKYNCLQSWSIKFQKKMEISNMNGRNYANNNNYKAKLKRSNDDGFFLEFSNFPMVLDTYRR